MLQRFTRVAIAIAAATCAAGIVLSSGCEPTCTFNGTTHDNGDTFDAGDGCNTCACGNDGAITCTHNGCGEGEGEGEGVGEGEGEGEGGTSDVDVAPIPDTECDVDPASQPGTFVVNAPVVAGADATTTRWRVTRAPIGSRPSLAPLFGETVTLTADSFGFYVLHSEVDVDGGAVHAEDCVIRDLPSNSLVVTMSWDTAVNDLDVHLVKRADDDQYCVTAVSVGSSITDPLSDCDNDLDCNWTNCRPTDTSNKPEWDGVDGITAGDPTLEIDDVDGFGPEILDVQALADGEYAVVVNVYTASIDADATVQVWLNGQLVVTRTFLVHASDVVAAVHIAVSNGDACVDDFSANATPVCGSPCTEDGAACGIGLVCDAQAAACVPDVPLCGSNDDCAVGACMLATDVCVVGECVDDTSCNAIDPRMFCDADVLRCVLGDPVCTIDVDEPNNSAGAASAVDGSGAFEGVMCRGDVDVVSFPVNANKHYTATVDFHGSGEPGIRVEMLDDNFDVVSSTVFEANNAVVQLAAVTTSAQSGTFFVRIIGAAVDQDFWSYAVSIVESDPLPPADCSVAGQPEEPNDDVAHATLLVPGQTTTFGRCGVGDVDVFRFDTTPQNGVRVTVGGFLNVDGNINITVVDDNGNDVGGGQSLNNLEQVVAPEGPSTYFVFVQASSSSAALANQTYNITADDEPRPAACLPDPTEPDGTTATAAPLTLAPDTDGNPTAVVNDVIRCSPQDVDNFRFTIPPATDGTVLLRFNHSEGDMALDLLDAASGLVIATSNTSFASSDPDELIAIPFAESAVDYIARVRFAAQSGGIVGQHYALEVHTTPQCTDDANDAAGASNETPATSIDVRPAPQPGTPVDFDSTIASASSLCAGDVDVYTFIAFAGEQVHVTMVDAPSVAVVATLGTRPADLNDDAIAVASTSSGATPIAFDNDVTQTLFVTVRAPATPIAAGPYTLTVTTTP